MYLRLLPTEERKRHKCYFCGETRSVKYSVTIRDGSEIIEVASCNKCVCTNNHQLLEERL